jgi:hypothetical protein
MLLFAGYAVKADTPCHIAITSYERQIDSLETRLATAQSLPYNQGYQEGYKQGSHSEMLTAFKFCIASLIIGSALTFLVIKVNKQDRLVKGDINNL